MVKGRISAVKPVPVSADRSRINKQRGFSPGISFFAEITQGARGEKDARRFIKSAHKPIELIGCRHFVGMGKSQEGGSLQILTAYGHH